MDKERPRGQNNETKAQVQGSTREGEPLFALWYVGAGMVAGRWAGLPSFCEQRGKGRGLDTSGSLARGGKAIWRGSGQESGKKLGEWQPTLKTLTKAGSPGEGLRTLASSDSQDRTLRGGEGVRPEEILAGKWEETGEE